MNNPMLNMMDESDREAVTRLIGNARGAHPGPSSSSTSLRRRLRLHRNDFQAAPTLTKFDRDGRVTELALAPMTPPRNDGGGTVRTARTTTRDGNRLFGPDGGWAAGRHAAAPVGEEGGRRVDDDDGHGHDDGGVEVPPPDPYWTLDGTLVGRLDRLRRLVVGGCRSLPLEALSMLARLESFEVHNCDGVRLAESAAAATAMTATATTATTTTTSKRWASLVRLEIRGGRWTASSMGTWMKWVCSSLPHLEELRFSFLEPSASAEAATAAAAAAHPNGAREGGREREAGTADENGIEGPRACGRSETGFLVDAVADALLGFGPSSTPDAGPPPLPVFRKSLKSLHWLHSGMKDKGLRRFLCEVVPLYPSLSALSVPGNDVSSIQFLLEADGGGGCSNAADRFRPPAGPIGLPLSTSLSKLILQHNPIMKTRTRYEPERRAFERLLDEACPFLGSLSMWEDWDPPIEGRLRVNRSAGRILFRQPQQPQQQQLQRKMEDDNNDGDDGGGGTRDVPAGLWPLILQRAYATSHRGFLPQNRHDATGVYYLLRHCLADGLR
jgi:hypothetical protein